MRGNEMNLVFYTKYILIAFISLLLSGCGGGDSPEDQIRKFIAAGEQAAESRSIGGIKDLISEQYADERGRTRGDIVAVAMRYFLANKKIHLLTRIKEVNILSEKKALVLLYVAMSGQDVQGSDSLMNVQADLYRFDLELILEGKEWLIIRADWNSAIRDDFF